MHVHCQSFAGNLVDVSAEAGSVQFDASGIPSDTTDLKRPICAALAAIPARREGARLTRASTRTRTARTKIWEDVLAVHTLAHEVWHLHGIGNKAQTECYALQTTARAAELFGADPGGCAGDGGVRLVRFYPNEPDEYRRADCANGGPLDLRPTDPVWP